MTLTKVNFQRGNDQPLKLGDAIDKLHIHSPDKLVKHLQKLDQFKDITEEQVQEEINKRPLNSAPHAKHKEHYYYPYFSNHLHGWSMDLLEQSRERKRDDYPAFWLVMININTKYADAVPCESKTVAELAPKIEEMVNKHNIKSIVCDKEGAFMSDRVVKMLKDKDVSLKIVTDERHTALAVIDRFIRTLRDMNIPTVKKQTTHGDEIRQSDNPKYRDFDRHRMEKILDIYNHTVHDNTGMTPEQMENDNHAEIKFIIRKIYEKERRS